MTNRALAELDLKFKAIKQAFSYVSANLTAVIESSWLAGIKQDLANERDSSVAAVVKRVKRSGVDFKSKGNTRHFEHQQQVFDCLTEDKDSLASAKYEKAKKAIEEDISLTEKRIKVIELANGSEFGWSTVSEYLSDELASNSEDEKRIFVPGVLSVDLNRQRVVVGSRRLTPRSRQR